VNSAILTQAPVPPRVKPLLRGWSHFVAFLVALIAGALLLARWPTVPALIYASSLVALFGISALYHRPNWAPNARMWMRRVDHSAIFLLVAGTFTPFSLVLSPHSRLLLLSMAWSGAALGLILSIAWPQAPKPLLAAVYLLLGWMSVLFVPEIGRALGSSGIACILGGGSLYSIGALTYALRRPDPWPRVFGYHEIFHAFVIVAAACHFVAVVECLSWVRPA
jgi:hemolysin III